MRDLGPGRIGGLAALDPGDKLAWGVLGDRSPRVGYVWAAYLLERKVRLELQDTAVRPAGALRIIVVVIVVGAHINPHGNLC